MFEKLSYKQKCIGLFGGFVLLLYLSYSLSFSKTFILQKEINQKETKLSWLKEKEKELPEIRSKMAEFESAYSKNDSIAVRDKLTSYISEFADKNNCLVTEIPTNSSFKNDNLKVQTNTFTIKGSFHNLLLLLNKLENEYRYISKIMSSKFYIVRDVQNKTKNLYLTIITQSFEQKTN